VTTLKDVLERPELLRIELRPKRHGQECRCEDCGYEALGALVEEHPIVSPRGWVR
jgi:hypothetical protein